MPYQPPLPPKYNLLTDEEMCEAIRQRRRALGSRLVILGHHYQQDEDYRLARNTSRQRTVAAMGTGVIFCAIFGGRPVFR